ncbi:MAG: hypothetical protein ACJ8AX_04015 [Gemmatimonadales bacterium]
MIDPVKLEPHPSDDTHGYSAAVRRVLGFTAFAITLLPIPILALKILPAYQKHAWFLLFYTPFLCLLTLCYLFYIRDALARVTFANVLDPPPPPDPYTREPLRDSIGRSFRRVKAAILGLLPAVLVFTSLYCIARYFRALDQSVALSVQTYRETAASDTLAYRVEKREKQDRGRSGRTAASQRKGARPDSSTLDSLARDSLVQDSLARAARPNPADTSAVRDYVLRTSEIDRIPRLAQLTAFYMGAFLALLVAVTLMALKEYAKEALGLSEHELMFGRYRRAPVEE